MLRETAAQYRERAEAAGKKFAGRSVVEQATERVLADAHGWLDTAKTD